MSKITSFVKMHGLGNDFIFVDCLRKPLPEKALPALGRAWCDRHFGIGADGLVLVTRSRRADFRMRVINPDGSEAEMCGNAMRCFAKYVYNYRLMKGTELAVETLAGIIKPKLTVHSGKVASVRVDMGAPQLLRSQIPMKGREERVIAEPLTVAGHKLNITCVSMGNPHCVTFVKDVDRVPLESWGPLIERHPRFPQRTNVEFAQVLTRSRIKMRVWERGVGPTMACGTGSCATVVAGVLNGRCERKATVQLPGGNLQIEWKAADDHLHMSGPATEAFSGTIVWQD